MDGETLLREPRDLTKLTQHLRGRAGIPSQVARLSDNLVVATGWA